MELAHFLVCVAFAYIVWTVIANIVIIHSQTNFETHRHNTSSPLWCSPHLFHFVSYSVIAHYVIFGLVVILLFLTHFLEVNVPEKS